MAIRAVIVDDEKPSREELKFLLKKLPEFEVVQEFDNAFDALAYISSNPVEVAFFDVNMPGFNGMKLAETLKSMENSPLIVFVTAYAEYAIKAFEINAIDYILKPVEEGRLLKTILKIKDKIKVSSPSNLRFILCDFRGEIVIVKPNEVVYFFVDNGKPYAKRKEDSLEVKNASISELEEKLISENFLRINKGIVINLNKIAKIIPMFRGRYVVQMEDGSKLPVSPHRQKEFRSKLKF